MIDDANDNRIKAMRRAGAAADLLTMMLCCSVMCFVFWLMASCGSIFFGDIC